MEHTTPNGTKVADSDVFDIRLFIYTETKGECSLPINSILKLIDIFDEFETKKQSKEMFFTDIYFDSKDPLDSFPKVSK
jgi:hypothetical protein